MGMPVFYFNEKQQEINFFRAIENKDYVTLSTWKEKGVLCSIVNYGKQNSDHTALMYAAEIGDLELLNYLLSVQGTQVNLTNTENQSALTYAINAGHLHVINRLLTHPQISVCVEEVNRAMNGGQVEIAQKLLQFLMLTATKKDNTALMQSLETSPLFNTCLNNAICPATQDTAFLVAIAGGYLNIIEYLLSLPKLDVNTITSNGRTALALAAQKGNKLLVDKLLTIPEINIDSFAVHAARENKHHDIATKLIKKMMKPEPHMNVKFEEQKSICFEWNAKVGSLFPEITHWVNSIHPQFQRTPLMIAAAQGELTSLHWLIKTPGIDLNLTTAEGKSALLFAIEENKLECVKLLLCTPSINLLRDGAAAIALAKEKNRYQILYLLTQYIPSNTRNNQQWIEELGYDGVIPTEYVCIFSLNIINDPITLSSGQTYDRESLIKYCDGRLEFPCPLTKRTIAASELDFCTNIVIKNLLVQFIEKIAKKKDLNNTNLLSDQPAAFFSEKRKTDHPKDNTPNKRFCTGNNLF